MKKELHIAISYLGYSLFFSGLLATITKWSVVILSIPMSTQFGFISLLLSIVIGTFLAFKICKPLTY